MPIIIGVNILKKLINYKIFFNFKGKKGLQPCHLELNDPVDILKFYQFVTHEMDKHGTMM